jgi:hypothetical protein
MHILRHDFLLLVSASVFASSFRTLKPLDLTLSVDGTLNGSG